MSTVGGASPIDLTMQIFKALQSSFGATIADAPVDLVINGAEVAAHQFSAKSPDDKLLFTSYFIARATKDGRTQFVHCLAVKADPEALKACRPTIDSLLTKGAPTPQRLVSASAGLEELFGHKIALPSDCDVTAGLRDGGGRVRCGDRLTLRWDPIPPTQDAAELDRFATGIEKQFSGNGAKVTRDDPRCRVRQMDASCVRLLVSQANVQYSFFLGSGPSRGKGNSFTIVCGARDDDTKLKGYCDELFHFGQ
jgi:hypothetical protein